MSMVQAAPANEPSGVTYFLVQSFPFLAIFVIFYFICFSIPSRKPQITITDTTGYEAQSLTGNQEDNIVKDKLQSDNFHNEQV